MENITKHTASQLFKCSKACNVTLLCSWKPYEWRCRLVCDTALRSALVWFLLSHEASLLLLRNNHFAATIKLSLLLMLPNFYGIWVPQSLGYPNTTSVFSYHICLLFHKLDHCFWNWFDISCCTVDGQVEADFLDIPVYLSSRLESKWCNSLAYYSNTVIIWFVAD